MQDVNALVERLQTLFSDRFHIEVPTADTDLLDSGIVDSLQFVDLLVTLDQRFHERLWELADHELLNELAAQVRGRIVAFLRAAARALPPEGLREHARTHTALVAAIGRASCRERVCLVV